MALISSRAAKARVILTFGCLCVAFVVSVLFFRDIYAELQSWLNVYDDRNLRLLEWARLVNLFVIVLTLSHLCQIMLRFPHHKRFYAMLIPFGLAFIYFFTQWLGTEDIYPRNGFIFMNLVSASLTSCFNAALNFAPAAHSRRHVCT